MKYENRGNDIIKIENGKEYVMVEKRINGMDTFVWEEISATCKMPSRVAELTKVAEFAKSAKSKKEVVDFAYSVFHHRADDTLVARTKKADLVNALEMRATELMKRAAAI